MIAARREYTQLTVTALAVAQEGHHEFPAAIRTARRSRRRLGWCAERTGRRPKVHGVNGVGVAHSPGSCGTEPVGHPSVEICRGVRRSCLFIWRKGSPIAVGNGCAALADVGGRVPWEVQVPA